MLSFRDDAFELVNELETELRGEKDDS